MTPTKPNDAIAVRLFLYIVFGVAVILMQAGTMLAADLGPRERISINDGWRFTKKDPAEVGENVDYSRRRTPDLTTGIAAYILPTGNDFIADASKRYTR